MARSNTTCPTCPPTPRLGELGCLAHQRWAIEQNYQQLKEDLGMDHFKGHSWRGLHHHLTFCLPAFCFLTQFRARQNSAHGLKSAAG